MDALLRDSIKRNRLFGEEMDALLRDSIKRNRLFGEEIDLKSLVEGYKASIGHQAYPNVVHMPREDYIIFIMGLQNLTREEAEKITDKMLEDNEKARDKIQRKDCSEAPRTS